jgi:hypothetical protein
MKNDPMLEGHHMKAARTLKARLQVLEERFGETSAQRQLELYCRCIDGDQQAVQEFELLITSGKAIPFLANLPLIFRSSCRWE